MIHMKKEQNLINFRKKSAAIAFMVGGALLVVLAVVLKLNQIAAKPIAGACLGVGFTIFSLGLAGISILVDEERNPKLKKQNEVEFNDERNVLIRNRAKAKSADILQWVIMGVAYITIIAGLPMWVTFCVVMLFVAKTAMELWLMSKYQKEM